MFGDNHGRTRNKLAPFLYLKYDRPIPKLIKGRSGYCCRVQWDTAQMEGSFIKLQAFDAIQQYDLEKLSTTLCCCRVRSSFMFILYQNKKQWIQNPTVTHLLSPRWRAGRTQTTHQTLGSPPPHWLEGERERERGHAGYMQVTNKCFFQEDIQPRSVQFDLIVYIQPWSVCGS